MAITRGKKRTGSSSGNVEENEAAENALTEMQASDSPIAKVEESMIDAHVEDQVEAIVKDAKNDEQEETHGEGKSEKMRQVENDHEDKTATETNGDNTEKSEKNTSVEDERNVIERNGEEKSEKMKEVENDHKNKTATETNGENTENSEKNTSVEDERNVIDAILEDNDNSEGSGEHFAREDEHVLGEDEVSEEEEIEKQDVYENEDEASEEEDMEDQDVGENEDEVSEEEGVGGEDDEEVKVSEEEMMEEECNEENNQEGKEITKDGEKGGERDTKGHNTEKAKVSLKKNEKSRQRRTKKKQAQTQKVSAEKPESSSKNKAKKKVKSMGMIFMCSSKTKDDCYKYKVLGLPESKKDIVVKIYSGMRLFLYDVELKLLYGIYKAAGPGGYNIEPKAFKSKFPSQVRFTILKNCLPLAEDKFKKVIKDNYFTKTKFDCKLNSEQVKNLCKLFLDSSKGRKSTKSSRTHKEAKPIRKGKASRQRAGDKRRRTSGDDSQYNERPHKRQREVIISPEALPPVGPSYVIARASDVEAYRRDPHSETRSPYRDRRNPISSHHDAYGDGRYPPTERYEYYREGRVYPERQYLNRDRRDYTDPIDPYRDVSGSSYPESRRRLYVEPRDTYRDGQDLYLDRHVSYRDGLRPEPYSSTYNRDVLPVRPGLYREDRGALELRDPYRREELVDRRDLPSLTRPSHIVGSPDSLVVYRGRLSYPEPVYSSEDYLPRSGSGRLYRP